MCLFSGKERLSRFTILCKAIDNFVNVPFELTVPLGHWSTDLKTNTYQLVLHIHVALTISLFHKANNYQKKKKKKKKEAKRDNYSLKH